jgi:hypothetical protein
VGRAISSDVKQHLSVFQKAKNLFKKRPQFFLVVFIGGEFAEPYPLFLICQIGQIPVVSAVYHRPYFSLGIRTIYAAAGCPATPV